MSAPDLLLLGCGILRAEVKLLCDRNGWPLERRWLSPQLHGRSMQLGRSLSLALAAHPGRDILVMYGCCHPQMDDIVRDAGTVRVPEQNCITMLLGEDVFAKEIEAGAYFLLEEWARDWEPSLKRAFGTQDPALIREIFQYDRKYLLALRTPCSGDFTEAAEDAARIVGLPLRWYDVGLDHLEQVLAEAIARRQQERCAQS